jgi:RimJ/RimL family protein N-acetyltransferase
MTRIRTARLLLRPARPGDAGALHGAFSDAAAMAYVGTPHDELAQTAAFVARMIATPPDAGEEFVVVLDGRVIGKAGFWRWPEVGFLLRREVWGRGLGTEAVAALVAHGFGARGLQRIEADVDPRNERSIRLLERLGFRETGRAANTIEIGGVWCDSIYLELRRPSG